MSLNNVLGTILKTIDNVQQKNKASKTEPTVDKDVFAVLKQKLKDLDQKTKDKRVAKGKSPQSILDLIKKEIEGVKKDNRANPKQETAPKSVFDSILKKVEAAPRRTASSGLKKIVEDYNLDISAVPQQTLNQLQEQYMKERRNFDNQIARAVNNVIKQYRK